MASSKEYLEYVLEQLSGLDDISYRPMMGEYIIYYCGKVIGGIYDDRFLLKETKSIKDTTASMARDIPYEGAKEMILVDIDDRELTCQMIQSIADDLPTPKKKE